jgi:hypothetical protein
VQRCPVVLVFEVRFRTIEHKRFCDVVALLWVLAEEVHHEVKYSLAVVVGFVDVCALFD